eukprot:TRINITY_DN1474_c0_g1_i4.p1 TRINITY_DN1474_c0_g1~~TRINITY_DN1474_c0_g1_i4.p1  ORF type:complete len:362 (-),score=139.90 TRINITY_DN1474_c0_g1_i4:60-1145(-)
MSSEFHSGFKRDTTGIHTVEGSLAGNRAAKLTKKREAQQAEYEAKKKKIQDEYKRGGLRIEQKFGGSATDQFEAMFKSKTVGLVTADEFRKAREEAEKVLPSAERSESGGTEGSAAAAAAEAEAGGEKKGKKKKKKPVSTLSFGGDDEEGEEGGEGPEESSSGKGAAKKVFKNPHVDTSFLPDREREAQMAREKSRLRQEWMQQQDRIKQELLEVTYSYWDGTGHRRTIKITKGTTVGKFLEAVRQQLSTDFSELRATSSDNLLYVKEDLIIPHSYSFYDLIVTKARGKSGPLFHFDVFDDVRLIHDATVEKDESHPGKVVERRWYERSKHIFPASRWEVYDPSKDYGDYTTHGREVNEKN